MNQHNQYVLNPKDFPFRPGTNFIQQNRNYEETHKFDQLLNNELETIALLQQKSYNDRRELTQIAKKKVGGYLAAADGVI